MFDPFVTKLLVALGIGALIGMEREQSAVGETFAGSRTFPLVALLGVILSEFLPEAVVPGLVIVAVVALAGYVGKLVTETGMGVTTSVAMVLTYVFGALVAASYRGLEFAVVTGVVVTALLAAKGPIHRFADQIERDELWGTLKFLIVSLVVLPLLPDQRLDVLLGLNPRFVWLMVVFVSGLSLSAYLLSKYLGTERGIVLTGILGGVASSTATTTSLASKSRQQEAIGSVAGFGIAIASVAMLLRIIIEVAVVNPALFVDVAVPVGLMLGVGATLLAAVYVRMRQEPAPDVELRNPFRLQPAILFGALFAAILLASEYGSEMFGRSGVYTTAVLSGLADVNAITLSLSRLAARGELEANVATSGIVLGAVTNTLTKLGIAWLFGAPGVRRVVTLVLGGVALAGLASLAVVAF